MIQTLDNVLGHGRQVARAGRWEEARELFGRAVIETCPAAQDRCRVADARRWRSIAGMRLGDWEGAARDAQHSLATASSIADVRREAQSVNVAAAVEFERGDWDRALSLFTRARTLARSADDRLLVAKIDNNEGAIWDARGVAARARRLFASAIAGFRASDQPVAAARAMNNLAVSLSQEAISAEALRWFRDAARIARQADEEDLLLTVLINLARAEAEHGELSRARVAGAEARALAGRMEGDPARADLCCALAMIARAEKRWLEAEQWIDHVLCPALASRNPLAAADAWEQRARIRLERGYPDESRDAIAKAEAAYRKLGAEGALQRLDRLAATLRREIP